MTENIILKKRYYKTKKLWSAEDENKLIVLWGERIEKLKGSRKTGHVYADIAKHLEKFTEEEIHNKVHNLTTKYNKFGLSGDSPSSWKNYHKIRKILHSLREKVPNSCSSMVEESFTSDEFDRSLPDTTNIKKEIELEPYQIQDSHLFLPTPPSPSTSSSSIYAKQKRKESFQQKILDELKKSNELSRAANEIAELALNQDRERNEMLKQLLINSTAIQAKLLEKL